jgi:hypothetical protein
LWHYVSFNSSMADILLQVASVLADPNLDAIDILF